MSGKVIDIDPTKRLTKEALTMVKEAVEELTIDNTDTLVVIYKKKDQRPNFEAYGLTWESLGITQTMLSVLAETLLADEFADEFEVDLED